MAETKSESKPNQITESERMINRVGMKPGSSYAIVELSIAIETSSWGPECSVGQITAQAVESAVNRLRNILSPREDLKPDNLQGVTVLGARCVKVICEAKKDR